MNGVAPPHGLKPRYDLGVDWGAIVALLLVIAFMAFVAWWVWKWWQRRQAAGKSRAPVPEVPVGSRVQDLLASLRAMTPADPFDARAREEFYWRLGLAFRTAVEWRTGIGATSLTIRELRDPLRKKLPLPSQETSEALDFLEKSEGIKFAGVPVTPADAVAARDATMRLIKRLFPGGEAVPRGEGVQ